MTRDEVLEQVKNLGVTISREALRRWVIAELVPEPTKGSLGRGRGTWSNYPIETPWEVFAAYHLLKEYSIPKTRQVREAALYCISECCKEIHVLEANNWKWLEENPGVTLEDFHFLPVTVDSSVFQWLMLRIKAEYALNIDMPISVRIHSEGLHDEQKFLWFGGDYTNQTFPQMVEFQGVKRYAVWKIYGIFNTGELTITEQNTLVANNIAVQGSLFGSDSIAADSFAKHYPEGEIIIESNRGFLFRLLPATGKWRQFARV